MPAIIPFNGRFRRAAFPRLARLTVAGLFALAAAGTVQAQSRFDEEFDDLNKPWQEIAIQLPTQPKPENLVGFDASETSSMRFAVDASSISVGEDDVVRYTLVSRSPSGAMNISYEGIRCQTQERKLYAFGHKDGSWSRSRRDQWERYTGTVANRQHATLAQDFFCDHKVVAGTAEQLVRNLRDRPLRERSLPQ